MNPWIEAARPKTLPAAVVPVWLGSALAASGRDFAFFPALICLSFALLIQIGTNFANDYFDFHKGADTKERIGPARAVASGWIAPRTMLIATIAVFVLALLTGSLLIPYGGYRLLMVGVLAVLFGVAYTGGPYPLSYYGVADVFVFIFFGFVATGFTYYVQVGTWPPELWMLGLIPGALSTNLLVVNNLRDIPTDRRANKRTLAVRLGFRAGVAQYAINYLLAFGGTLILGIRLGSAWIVLPWLLAGWAHFLTIRLVRSEGRGHDRWLSLLASTGKLLLLYGFLQGVGLLLA